MRLEVLVTLGREGRTHLRAPHTDCVSAVVGPGVLLLLTVAGVSECCAVRLNLPLIMVQLKTLLEPLLGSTVRSETLVEG